MFTTFRSWKHIIFVITSFITITILAYIIPNGAQALEEKTQIEKTSIANIYKTPAGQLKLTISQPGIKKWKIKFWKNNIVRQKTVKTKNSVVRWAIPSKNVTAVAIKSLGNTKTRYTHWTTIFGTIPDTTNTQPPIKKITCDEAKNTNDIKWLAENCGWFPGGESGGNSWLFPIEKPQTERPAEGLTIHARGKLTNCYWFGDNTDYLYAEVEWSIPLPDKYFKNLGRINIHNGGVIPGGYKNGIVDDKLLYDAPVEGTVAYPTTLHDVTYSLEELKSGETIYLDGKRSGDNTGDATWGDPLISWDTVETPIRDANFDQRMLGIKDGSRVGAVATHAKPWLEGNTSINIDKPYFNIVTESVPLRIDQCSSTPIPELK